MLIGLQGPTREYIYSLPVTITVVLLLSYVLAMTSSVLLSYWFVKAPVDPDASLSPVIQAFAKLKKLVVKNPSPKKQAKGGGLYANLSRSTLRFKWAVVVVSFGSLFGVMQLPVGSEFFPQDIRDQFTIDVWLPEGANIHQTDDATRQVEEIILGLSPRDGGDRLRAMASYVGGGMPRWYLGRNPETGKFNFAEIVVRTTDGSLTGNFAEEIQRVVQEGDENLGLEPVTGARIIVRQLMMGPVVDAPIGIRIYGPRLGAGFADIAVMREQASGSRRSSAHRPDTWDTYDSWGSDGYQLRVEVNEDRANLAGVTNDGIARTLNAFFSGHRLDDVSRRRQPDPGLLAPAAGAARRSGAAQVRVRRGPLRQGTARLGRLGRRPTGAGEDRPTLFAARDRGAHPQQAWVPTQRHHPRRLGQRRVRELGERAASGLLEGGRRRAVRIEQREARAGVVVLHLHPRDHPAADHPVQRVRQAADHPGDTAARAHRGHARPVRHQQSPSASCRSSVSCRCSESS